MANIHELDFGPAVDEHGLGILLKQRPGSTGIK